MLWLFVVNYGWWTSPWAPIGLWWCSHNLPRSASLTVILIASRMRPLCRTIHCKSCRGRSPKEVAVCLGIGRTAADRIAAAHLVHPISYLQAEHCFNEQSGRQPAMMGGQKGRSGHTDNDFAHESILHNKSLQPLSDKRRLLMNNVALQVPASCATTRTDAGLM